MASSGQRLTAAAFFALAVMLLLQAVLLKVPARALPMSTSELLVHSQRVQTPDWTKGVGPFSHGAEPTSVRGIGPAWTRGEVERPAGEKDMGSWTASVYTAEQQARLRVTADGTAVSWPSEQPLQASSPRRPAQEAGSSSVASGLAATPELKAIRDQTQSVGIRRNQKASTPELKAIRAAFETSWRDYERCALGLMLTAAGDE